MPSAGSSILKPMVIIIWNRNQAVEYFCIRTHWKSKQKEFNYGVELSCVLNLDVLISVLSILFFSTMAKELELAELIRLSDYRVNYWNHS